MLTTCNTKVRATATEMHSHNYTNRYARLRHSHSLQYIPTHMLILVGKGAAIFKAGATCKPTPACLPASQTACRSAFAPILHADMNILPSMHKHPCGDCCCYYYVFPTNTIVPCCIYTTSIRLQDLF